MQQIAEDLPALRVSFTQSQHMAVALSELLLGRVREAGVMDLLAFRWSGSVPRCGGSGVILGSFVFVLRVSINFTWSWELLRACVSCSFG